MHAKPWYVSRAARPSPRGFPAIIRGSPFLDECNGGQIERSGRHFQSEGRRRRVGANSKENGATKKRHPKVALP